MTIELPPHLTIARVTPLMGHTSPETAYVVDDYPYGRILRCKIRYWIETLVKGPAKNKQRFVSQTTNPKVDGEVWNKPKPATSALLAYMYKDNETGHVEHLTIPFATCGDEDTRVRHMGIYDALSNDDRAHYDALLTLSRKLNRSVWTGWHSRVAQLAGYMRETGTAPTVDDSGMWTDLGGSIYLDDPAAYVTAALDLINQDSNQQT